MRRWLFALLLGLLLWSGSLASPAGASAPEGGVAAREAELVKEGKKDILDLRYDLGLWTIVVFLGLFFILRRYAWGPILEGLHKREDTIRTALAEAQRARQEANRIHADLQAQLDRAGAKVAEIMDSARRDAARMHEEMTGKARTEIQVERDRLRREIELARDQALHELWTQTAQLATLISAKALGRQMNEADHRHLVEEALADLRQAGSAWVQQGAGVRL